MMAVNPDACVNSGEDELAPCWERSKENVKPLSRGRDVDTLNSALGLKLKSSAEARQSFADFLAALPDNAQPEVTIDACYGFVLNLEETTPAGCSSFASILESIVTRFGCDESLKQNERNLRLWLTYAEQLRDATDVYAFMSAYEIGVDHSLFYEMWTDFLEQRDRLREADELYRVGIARLEFCSRLQSQYESFLSRATERIFRLQNEEALEGPHRQAIPRPTTPASTDRRDRAPRFAVYFDESPAGLQAAPDGHTSSAPLHTITTAPAQLQEHIGSRKENIQRPERWNERGPSMPIGNEFSATMSRLNTSATAAPRVAVYCDESSGPVLAQPSARLRQTAGADARRNAPRKTSRYLR